MNFCVGDGNYINRNSTQLILVLFRSTIFVILMQYISRNYSPVLRQAQKSLHGH